MKFTQIKERYSSVPTAPKSHHMPNSLWVIFWSLIFFGETPCLLINYIPILLKPAFDKSSLPRCPLKTQRKKRRWIVSRPPRSARRRWMGERRMQLTITSKCLWEIDKGRASICGKQCYVPFLFGSFWLLLLLFLLLLFSASWFEFLCFLFCRFSLLFFASMLFNFCFPAFLQQTVTPQNSTLNQSINQT